MLASDTNSELMPVEFRQELAGRLRNIGKLKHWWMAVAEAVNNAFDSIQDSGRPGSVEVKIEREDDLLAKAGVEGPVRNIVVSDDANGFHEINFTSFSTPDSLHKLSRGGKGLGRLMCLQAFEQVHVSSRFCDGTDWKLRRIASRNSLRQAVAEVEWIPFPSIWPQPVAVFAVVQFGDSLSPNWPRCLFANTLLNESLHLSFRVGWLGGLDRLKGRVG